MITPPSERIQEPQELCGRLASWSYDPRTDVTPRDGRSPEGIMAVTTLGSRYLEGAAAVTYPPVGKFQVDSAAMNPDLFFINQGADALLVGPRQDGLYCVTFSTWMYAPAASKLALWILRTPGNGWVQYATLDVAAGSTELVTLQRHVRLQAWQGLYVAIRQIAPEGKVRVWDGGTTLADSLPYSCLTLTVVR